MKLASVLAAAALSYVYAQGTVSPASDAPTSTSSAPAASLATPAASSTAPSATPAASSGSSNSSAPAASTASGASPLDGLKQKAYGSEYHMPYVRVVQARVQSDKPELIKGRFVSSFGKGDLEKGYMSALDTVNTASVEGALMFVQAECINDKLRSKEKRCERKNKVNYVVLYEILIAQTNESIAQFQDDWNLPEYGPMAPMDGGRCTPLKDDKFPPECLQFNGDEGQPNLGPYVGGGLKTTDQRALYPDTYWFSFPNTCPLSVWGEKNDANNACRAKTRKGLCDIGKAPDGVECTFAYDILGWVPLDDVVGITQIKDDSGNLYGNFSTWCEASEKNIEFSADDVTKDVVSLPFWEDPTNVTRNTERASKVIELYQDMLLGNYVSPQITKDDLSHFKTLPSPDELAAKNPPCYKSVSTCNSGNGCQRRGFSQICEPCESASDLCKTDKSFTFPKLEKAKSAVPESEQTSGSNFGGANGATGSITKKNNSTSTPTAGSLASHTSLAAAVAAVSALAALAL